jgi:starch synthase (maltosyl-transferring)
MSKKVPASRPKTSELDAVRGRARVVIETVTPQVDCGRYAIKRIPGESVTVRADVFCDGHDAVACDVLYRERNEAEWDRVPMVALGNDRWEARFDVQEIGECLYTVAAWVDPFATWCHDLEKRRKAGQDLTVAYQVGARLILSAAERAPEVEANRLRAWAASITGGPASAAHRYHLALDPELAAIMRHFPDPETVATYAPELRVAVEPRRARCSAWYEMFPRSCSPEPGRHGTFRECEARLPYIAEMGFDVLYLPPIHPIGLTFRKGKNNRTECEPDDVGSPWGIGAAAGGHKAIHPDLGTLKDFRGLIERARELGIELAMDIAFQCSPDHPYVTEHPEWFQHRPDGSIQYAENPPKKYQDIYPFNFETAAWQELWRELESVMEFWIEQGVTIFRVDNPHTKPFAFWEWAIDKIKDSHPETIFLAEAFTRPRVMHRLAKLGFSQSYTYFTWRNTKDDLTGYFTELNHDASREYFRPNVWPNTPDILHETLQVGGRPAFVSRLVLAATLAANYGIYGPAYELSENRPREAGSEEYLDSEKYQIRNWDLGRADSLRSLIARLNAIRREHPALQRDWNLRFYPIDNEQLIAYAKSDDDGEDTILVVVNLDPFHVQTGWVELPLAEFGLTPDHPFQVHDLLSGARYIWEGARNYISLDPQMVPAHVFRVLRRVRTERDFDYFM